MYDYPSLVEYEPIDENHEKYVQAENYNIHSMCTEALPIIKCLMAFLINCSVEILNRYYQILNRGVILSIFN